MLMCLSACALSAKPYQPLPVVPCTHFFRLNALPASPSFHRSPAGVFGDGQEGQRRFSFLETGQEGQGGGSFSFLETGQRGQESFVFVFGGEGSC